MQSYDNIALTLLVTYGNTFLGKQLVSSML